RPRARALGLLLFAGATACGGPSSGSSAASARASGSGAGIPAPRPAVAIRPTPDLTKPHPLTVHDMVRAERVGEPVPSPDGKWIAYTRRAWDPDPTQKTTTPGPVAPDGATTKQLTTAKGVADGGPVWSPDSKSIVFTSSREGAVKAWVVRVDGGEPRKLLEFAVDVDNLRMAPDGSRLAFSAEVYPDASAEETAKRDAERAKNPMKGRAFDRLMVRHWDTWFEGRRSHLFVVALTWDGAGDPNVDGAPIDLMKGVDADCPTKPFGGIEDYA